MKKSIILFITITGALFSCKSGGTSTPKTVETATPTPAKHVQGDMDRDAQYEYTDAQGKRITLQNGLPKGGTLYTAPNGEVYSYAVFWTQVINETDYSLELKFDLPEHDYELSNVPGKYYKILVPADTMTLDKLPLMYYGLPDIASFLDHNLHKSSSLQRTIHPKTSSGFYFIMLILTETATGMTRTGLSLKGQDLYYHISRYSTTKPVSLVDEKEIHCGRINLKNLVLRK